MVFVDGKAHTVQFSLLLGFLFEVQLPQSFVAESLQLSVGIVKLRLDVLGVCLLLAGHFLLLLRLVPGGCSSNSLHSGFKLTTKEETYLAA